MQSIVFGKLTRRRTLSVSVTGFDTVELEQRQQEQAAMEEQKRQEDLDQAIREFDQQEQARKEREAQEERARRQRKAQEEQAREQQEVAARQAAAEAEGARKAAALRNAAIDPSSLSINLTAGTIWYTEGIYGNNTSWQSSGEPGLMWTVVNHSNKTLRSIKMKVQVRECPTCAINNEITKGYTVEIPINQQRSFGYSPYRDDITGRANFLKRDGKPYTWKLITASACRWSAEDVSVLSCEDVSQ